MRTVKHFEEYVQEGIVKRVKRNQERAKSLLIELHD